MATANWVVPAAKRCESKTRRLGETDSKTAVVWLSCAKALTMASRAAQQRLERARARDGARSSSACGSFWTPFATVSISWPLPGGHVHIAAPCRAFWVTHTQAPSCQRRTSEQLAPRQKSFGTKYEPMRDYEAHGEGAASHESAPMRKREIHRDRQAVTRKTLRPLVLFYALVTPPSSEHPGSLTSGSYGMFYRADELVSAPAPQPAGMQQRMEAQRAAAERQASMPYATSDPVCGYGGRAAVSMGDGIFTEEDMAERCVLPTQATAVAPTTRDWQTHTLSPLSRSLALSSSRTPSL